MGKEVQRTKEVRGVQSSKAGAATEIVAADELGKAADRKVWRTWFPTASIQTAWQKMARDSVPSMHGQPIYIGFHGLN